MGAPTTFVPVLVEAEMRVARLPDGRVALSVAGTTVTLGEVAARQLCASLRDALGATPEVRPR